MTNISKISAEFDPRSATDPLDLAQQAQQAWIRQAANSGVTVKPVAGKDSIGVVVADGELYSLDMHGSTIEAHKISMSKAENLL